MKQLTERDKNLLWFLGIFLVIAFCGKILIMPALDEYYEAALELENAKFLKEQAVRQSVEVPALQQSINKMSEEVAKYKEKYKIYEYTEDIEYGFTDFMVSNGLFADSQVISVVANKEKSGDDAKNTEKDKGAADTKANSSKELVRFNVTIQTSGNRARLLDFLNLINQNYSYRLVSMEIGSLSENAFGRYVIEVVMVDGNNNK